MEIVEHSLQCWEWITHPSTTQPQTALNKANALITEKHKAVASYTLNNNYVKFVQFTHNIIIVYTFATLFKKLGSYRTTVLTVGHAREIRHLNWAGQSYAETDNTACIVQSQSCTHWTVKYVNTLTTYSPFGMLCKCLQDSWQLYIYL